MGLESALVDRARVIRKEPVGDGDTPLGMTRLVEVEGTWFDALLQLPDSPEAPDASQGRRRVVRVPTLLTDVFDDDNQPVDFNNQDKIQVVSLKFGTAIWEMTGDPLPLASLEEIIGYSCTVKRIVDHETRAVA